VSALHESIEKNLKKKISDSPSIWSWTAIDDDHREWVKRYNVKLARNQKAASIDDAFHFNDIGSWLQFLGTAAFDGYQRFRMRSLKSAVLSYEEFMVGVMDSFKALQSIDASDTKTISRCFAKRMHGEVGAVRDALFALTDDGGSVAPRTSIRNLVPFGGALRISGLYGGAEQSHLEYLEMLFCVRIYYALQSVEDPETVQQRYADIEWLGLFQPQSSGEDGKYDRYQLCAKGFVINNIEVQEC